MAATTDTKPFAPFEWLLASRYLRARRKEGFVSVIAAVSFLGIMLGVATLIIVMAVMNGFRKDLFSKILGLNGHVVVYKVGAPFTDYVDVTKAVSRADGVVRAIPLIEGQVMVSSAVQALGAAVRGIGEEDLKHLPLVADNIRYGTLDGFDHSGGLAIGMRLANMLRINVGDPITIISPRGASTPFGTAPRSKTYPVTTIFELGMAEYDKTMIFMPLAEAQRYFAIFTVLEVERNVMFIILSLIVLVAALNIISGLMMLVKDKGRDIAILRTMGASKGSVMRIFLITGASIGVVGTLAGLVIGIVFCAYIEEIRQFVAWMAGTTVFDPNVYYLTRLPADVNPVETGSIVLMALVLSVLATLYPSWRASRLDPVEALRYE
ncbi:MAG: FtsX-like permease family protein [Rhizobiales bacterium]|nr:FtsX-like permease family protein [Hyphomicrobiales bacterium]